MKTVFLFLIEIIIETINSERPKKIEIKIANPSGYIQLDLFNSKKIKENIKNRIITRIENINPIFNVLEKKLRNFSNSLLTGLNL